MKEIVTIQVGTTANYVGTHFWNLQEEYLATPVQHRDLSPAALFSEVFPTHRAYASGLRYAPRLQIIDGTGAFGALSTQAGVVLPSSPRNPAISAWSGLSQTVKREPVPRSKYTRHIHAQETTANITPIVEPGERENPPLNDINYWTDFLKVRLHPRTCFQLPGVHHQVSNVQYFVTGEQLIKPLVEDLYQDLRHFVEECDSFGGLNLITNADDAFSGVTAGYLCHTVEELGSSLPVMVIGTHSLERIYKKQDVPFTSAHSDRYGDLRLSANEAQLVASCIDYSAEYFPLASALVHKMPHLYVERDNIFQTSSVLGLALDVALIPLRQRLSLSGLLGSIRPAPFATVGSLACNLPLPSIQTHFHFARSLFETEGTVNLSALWNGSPSTSPSLNSNGAIPLRCFECVSARGVRCKLPIASNIRMPVALPNPFPSVFDRQLSPDYNLTGNKGASISSSVHSGIQLDRISIVAGLGTVPEQGQGILAGLAASVHKRGMDTNHGVDQTHLRELKETLISRADDYGNM